jgi:hypothetical protein
MRTIDHRSHSVHLLLRVWARAARQETVFNAWCSQCERNKLCQSVVLNLEARQHRCQNAFQTLCDPVNLSGNDRNIPTDSNRQSDSPEKRQMNSAHNSRGRTTVWASIHLFRDLSPGSIGRDGRICASLWKAEERREFGIRSNVTVDDAAHICSNLAFDFVLARSELGNHFWPVTERRDVQPRLARCAQAQLGWDGCFERGLMPSPPVSIGCPKPTEHGWSSSSKLHPPACPPTSCERFALCRNEHHNGLHCRHA